MAHDGLALTSPPLPRVSGNIRTHLRTAWIFTVLWNAISAPVLFIVPRELDRQPLAAIAFLFPVAGVGLLIWAVRTTARWHRFGATWLDASSTPRPGRTWSGAVHAQLPQPAPGRAYVVMARLTCLERTFSRSDGERTVHERILWRDEQDIASSRIAFTPGGASVPFRFVIPSDAGETTAVGMSEGILWVVTAEASLPGIDLKDDFDVVVQRADGEPVADGPKASPAPSTPVTLEELAAAGIAVQPVPGGLAVRFAPMRNVSMAAGTTAFALIWTAAIWFQIRVGFPWIFPVITGLFDLLLITVVLDLWLGATTTVVANREVRRRHGLLGLGTARRFAAAEIARLELHISMQTAGRYGTPYYDVRAVLTSGRKVSLGAGIRNKHHAEWIASELRGRLR